jgi:hypothetical protein
MKTKVLFFLFLITSISYGQFNSSAPWMLNVSEEKKGNLSIDEIKSSFDAYWLSNDKNVKGSGYKPFMRWEYHWRNKTNPQGMLLTPEEIWEAWRQKNQAKLQRSASSVLAPTSNWLPVGPSTHTNTGSWSSGQGRVNIVYVDPSNSNTLYIGAPAGGIWKSADNGVNWLPLSDYLPQIGVSGIVVDYANSNVIYIATGDKDASDTYSIGVLKSTDGGITWNTTGLTFTNTSSRAGDIIMDPTNNQTLFCATSEGLYRTINGGTTWNIVQAGNFAQGSLRFKPGNPNTIYAVSNNSFFVSINSGSTFSNITTGLPLNSGRMILDVTAANQNVVYLLSANTDYSFQGLYKSTDSGNTWVKTLNTANIFESSQAWFDLALAVSNTNENEVYTGCLNVWKSTNSGTSFVKLNNWSDPNSPAYTHADIHYLGFHGNKLFCGSDGGIYVSTNNGIVFTDLTATAQISQFYKIAVSKQSSSNMVGGLQDNGGHAFSNNAWKNYYGADGMDTAISPINPNLYYGFIQNGGGLYISNNAGNSLTSSVNAPAGISGNWVTPLVSDSLGEIYAGYDGLYILTGSSWEQQNITSVGSGNLELIKIDPLNDNVIYVANENVLYKSIDKGITFSALYFNNNNITSIAINSNNTSIIYLTTQGNNGQALKSINGGDTFTNISTGLPNIGKNVIVHQGNNTNNPLFLGTSLGVYYLDDLTTSWEPFDTNLPNVSVTDLEINIEDSKLIAATYGRGIWQTDIPTLTPSDDVKLSEIQNPTFNINCDTNLSPIIKVKNNGLNSISTVNVTYSIDGGTLNNFTWNGTINPNQFETITLPTQNLLKGNHTINVSTTIPNDAFQNNNSLTTFFNLNDSGTIGQVNGFSSSANKLLSYNENNQGSQWVRGSRATGSLATGSNVVYATNLTGNYPDNVKSYLVSQCYDLSNVSNPQISFKFQYDLELNWDLIYVEYSTNFGATWSVLGESGPNWYNSDRTSQTTGSDCFNCVGAQWTGTNFAFNTYSYPLTSLIGNSNVIFRFVFHTDQNTTKLGANVDDFVISGILSNENFELNNVSIYPNPSKGIFTLSLGDIEPTSIVIYDITGKIISSNKNIITTNYETSLDISNASSGIYFVKIEADNQSIVKRIIKQ